MGVANSFSYSDLTIRSIDNSVTDAQKTIFQEISYFSGCRYE